MAPINHNILFTSLLLQTASLLSMKVEIDTVQSLKLQMFHAIHDNDPHEVAQLLAQGAKVQNKAKKN